MTKCLFAIFALVAPGLVACHPHSASNFKPPALATGQQVIVSEAARELTKYPLVCQGGPCPAGVGIVTAQSDYGFNTCTGFIVGERSFVTSRQCLPETLKRVGASCRGLVAVGIKDSTLGDTPRILNCVSVTDLSSGQESFAADFAVLELDATPVIPAALPLARDGVHDGQLLTAWTVTRVGGSNVIAGRPCRSVFNSVLNPTATNPLATVGLAIGCGFEPGGAGAPILNERGEAVGLVHMRARGKQREAATATLKQIDVSLPETVPPHTTFTNLACIADPISGAAANPLCTSTAAAPSCAVDPVAADIARARIIREIEASLPPIFRYDITYFERDESIVVQPTCAASIDQSRAAWDQNVQLRRRYVLFPNHVIEVYIPGVTKLVPHFRVDADLRLQPTVEYQLGTQTPHALSLLYDRRVFAGKITRSRGDGSQLVLPISIPECAKGAYAAGNSVLHRSSDGRVMPAEAWRQRLINTRSTRTCAQP